MSAALAVGVFTAAYLLIATEKADRVAVALGGAGLMLALQLLSSEDAFHSERLGIDSDVIFLLLGMMVIVGVLKHTGLFDYLAIWSAKHARARPARILATLVLITAVASALLDNVTTVLLVAPVAVLICERLGIPVVPFLIAEALASNIGGTATLIGDPPNIIIASQAGLSYTSFLVHPAPLVVVLLAVFILLLRRLFGRALTYHPERAAELLALKEREAIFVGLFIMVGALVKTGVVTTLANAAANATGGSMLVASGLLLWVSGALVETMPDGHDPRVLWWVAGAGRGPWRQRHGDRRQRQRGCARPGRPSWPPHRFPRVRQVRRAGRRGHDGDLHAVPVAALLPARLKRTTAHRGSPAVTHTQGSAGRSTLRGRWRTRCRPPVPEPTCQHP